MRKSFKSVARLSAGLLLMAACSGDPTGTNAGDPLTSAEIQALFNELGASFSQINAVPALALQGDAPAWAALQSGGVPVSVNVDVNQTVPCEQGTISINGSVDGSIDSETFLGSVTMDFSWGFNGCLVSTETTGVTLSGDDPSIAVHAVFTFGANEFTTTGTEVGGFSYTVSDGRSGSCAIDISFETSVNTETNAISATVSGSVCGQSAEEFNVAVG